MATLVRIRLPNRTEYRKLVWSKKDSILVLGSNYHIDYNKGFFTTIWGGLLKVVCLDYEEGHEEPISYFDGKVRTSTELRPHHVSAVIRSLIEEIPHFQWIVIIALIAIGIIAGVSAYYGYDASSKVDLLRKFLVNSSWSPYG